MKKIVGFFTAHGPRWRRKFPLIMKDIEGVFSSSTGVNIVLLENRGLDSSVAEEIYRRSANEKDLLKLWHEYSLKKTRVY